MNNNVKNVNVKESVSEKKAIYQSIFINSLYLVSNLRRSEDTGKFLLLNLAALTNSIYCNSQHGTLMNRFPVMMTPIGWREFPTIFWSELRFFFDSLINGLKRSSRRFVNCLMGHLSIKELLFHSNYSDFFIYSFRQIEFPIFWTPPV